MLDHATGKAEQLLAEAVQSSQMQQQALIASKQYEVAAALQAQVPLMISDGPTGAPVAPAPAPAPVSVPGPEQNVRAYACPCA